MKFEINGHTWYSRFVPKCELTEDTDGNTDYNERTINIRDDLDMDTTRIVVQHELTHAYLCSEGRYTMKSMTQEEMCEWVGWHADQIATLATNICKSKPFEKEK